MPAITNEIDVILQAAITRGPPEYDFAAMEAAIAAAQAAADAAQADADAATSVLAVIASDSWLSKGEKPAVVKEQGAISSEYADILAKAAAQSVSSTSWQAAKTALDSYLGALSPAWNLLTSDTPIVGTDFRAAFNNYYAARTLLLNAIAADAATRGNNAQTTANTALADASSAQSAANAANTVLAVIASDSWLSKGEKPAVVKEWSAIDSEISDIVSKAGAASISSSSFTTAKAALDSYLTGLSPSWSDVTTDTAIVAATFRAKFNDYYLARQLLLNAIAADAKARADAAQGTANTGVTNAAAAQAAANAANAVLAVIASDSWLSKGEKPAVIKEWNAVNDESADIVAKAAGQSVSSTSYSSSKTALSSYLTGLSPGWSDVSVDTPIVAADFRAAFNNYYLARQLLLNAIAADAAARGNNAQGTANTAVTNAATAQAAAVAAAGDATAALASLTAIFADNVLSRDEKTEVVRKVGEKNGEYAGILAQAAALSVSSTAYAAANTALNSYLTGLSPAYNDLTQNTAIVRADANAAWNNYYAAKVALLNAIAAAAAAAGAQAGTNLRDSTGAVMTDAQVRNGYTENGIGHVTRPLGGSQAYNTPSKTGAIEIALPAAMANSNTMLRIRLEIYEYNSTRSCTYILSGYNYSSGWYNTSASYDGPVAGRKRVRFGSASGRNTIYIGDCTADGAPSVWEYPMLKISEVTAGYSNQAWQNWAGDWLISINDGVGSIESGVTIATPGVGGAMARIDGITSGNAPTYIAAGAITDTMIGGNLASTNWSGSTGIGGTGWLMDRTGNLYANSVALRGHLKGGSITGWAWPAAGLDGFYLGSEGLLLGNANNGRYFEITSAGDVYAPNFTIIAGTANFSGTLSAATGSFAGSLSAATGSFAGTLSAATGTFGNVTIAAGGSIASGQSAYNTGTGFFLGLVSGVPKLSIGNPSGARMTWDGTTLTVTNATVVGATLTGQISDKPVVTGGFTSGSGSNGSTVSATQSASTTGGRSGYSYTWTIVKTGVGAGTVVLTGSTGSSVTASATGPSNSVVYADIIVTSVDANGSVSTDSENISFTFGTPP